MKKKFLKVFQRLGPECGRKINLEIKIIGGVYV